MNLWWALASSDYRCGLFVLGVELDFFQEGFGEVEFDVAYDYVGWVYVGRDGFFFVFENEGQGFPGVSESLVGGISEGEGFG